MVAPKQSTRARPEGRGCRTTQQREALGIEHRTRLSLNIGNGIRDAVNAVPCSEDCTSVATAARQPNCRWNRDPQVTAYTVCLRLVAAKPKQFVLDDVGARCAAILFERDRDFWLQSAGGVMVKEIPRIERIEPDVGVCGTVQFVDAGLEAYAGNRPRFPSELCRRVHLGVEFLNCIDRKKRGCIADDRGS